jgi:hypothetical protein
MTCLLSFLSEGSSALAQQCSSTCFSVVDYRNPCRFLNFREFYFVVVHHRLAVNYR